MKIKFFKQPQNINYYYENFYSDEKINGTTLHTQSITQKVDI